MESKVERKICGTCIFWNGSRELLQNKRKVAILDEYGTCACPVSSKHGEIRKKDAQCKVYENLLEDQMR